MSTAYVHKSICTICTVLKGRISSFWNYPRGKYRHVHNSRSIRSRKNPSMTHSDSIFQALLWSPARRWSFFSPDSSLLDSIGGDARGAVGGKAHSVNIRTHSNLNERTPFGQGKRGGRCWWLRFNWGPGNGVHIAIKIRSIYHCRLDATKMRLCETWSFIR